MLCFRIPTSWLFGSQHLHAHLALLQLQHHRCVSRCVSSVVSSPRVYICGSKKVAAGLQDLHAHLALLQLQHPSYVSILDA